MIVSISEQLALVEREHLQAATGIYPVVRHDRSGRRDKGRIYDHPLDDSKQGILFLDACKTKRKFGTLGVIIWIAKRPAPLVSTLSESNTDPIR